MTETKHNPIDDKPMENPYTGNITVGVANFDYLIGDVFTHFELLGLTDRQLSALKKTTREMFWNWYNSHLPNPMGLADPSKQAREEVGLN